jgi:hypothetical protein
MPWPLYPSAAGRLPRASCREPHAAKRERGLGVEAASCRFVRNGDGSGSIAMLPTACLRPPIARDDTPEGREGHEGGGGALRWGMKVGKFPACRLPHAASRAHHGKMPWPLYPSAAGRIPHAPCLMPHASRRIPRTPRQDAVATLPFRRRPPASYRMPPASCRIPPAASRIPHAACRLPHAACLMPHAASRAHHGKMPWPLYPSAACRLPHAACRLPQATCPV